MQGQLEYEQEELTKGIGKFERQAINISDQIQIEAQVYFRIYWKQFLLYNYITLYYVYLGVITFIWDTICSSTYGSGSAVRILRTN